MVEVSRSGSIVECVPNFSEGRDVGVVREIVRAMRVDGVHLLDMSLDPDHNRSVVTIAGVPDAVVEAAVRAVSRAAELIDLTAQRGVHPRIGAADVVPFVPVRGITMADCVALARSAGVAMAQRAGVPVYFYEAAALRPDRVNLEDVRRGQFEGLLLESSRDTRRRPDVGGHELHPTAGATAVGARQFLIAFNVYLADGADVATARAIARELRGANGGLDGVKAMGVAADGRAQVSMNLTDFTRTPVARVYEQVCRLAAKHGVAAGTCELIGLIPEAAFDANSEWVRQTPGFAPDDKVLERRLAQPIAWP